MTVAENTTIPLVSPVLGTLQLSSVPMPINKSPFDKERVCSATMGYLTPPASLTISFLEPTGPILTHI